MSIYRDQFRETPTLAAQIANLYFGFLVIRMGWALGSHVYLLRFCFETFENLWLLLFDVLYSEDTPHFKSFQVEYFHLLFKFHLDIVVAFQK